MAKSCRQYCTSSLLSCVGVVASREEKGGRARVARPCTSTTDALPSTDVIAIAPAGVVRPQLFLLFHHCALSSCIFFDCT